MTLSRRSQWESAPMPELANPTTLKIKATQKRSVIWCPECQTWRPFTPTTQETPAG